MRQLSLVLVTVLSVACSDRTSGSIDAGRTDAGAGDASIDSGTTDAGIVDAGLFDAGGRDAGDRDTDASGPVVIENAPLGAAGSGGLQVTSNIWPGWRFELTAAMTTRRIGFFSDRFGSGTGFGAIVRLDGPTDEPDAADLSGADVLAMTTLPLDTSGPARDISGMVTASLAPGWYAVVFGTGAFGSSGATTALGDHPGSAGAQVPFVIRQSDGMFISQDDVLSRFFVEATLD